VEESPCELKEVKAANDGHIVITGRARERITVGNRTEVIDIYTVNHQKRGILFLTITLANLNRFYGIYIILIAEKLYMQM